MSEPRGKQTREPIATPEKGGEGDPYEGISAETWRLADHSNPQLWPAVIETPDGNAVGSFFLALPGSGLRLRLILDAPKFLRQTRDQATRIAALEAEVEQQRQRAERAERERDALMAAWPSDDSRTVFEAACPEGWYVWGIDEDDPVYPTREQAIRVAAGIERASQAGGEGTT